MSEFIAKSGAKVVIGLAPWQDARKLKAAVEREVAAAGVELAKGKAADAGQLIAALMLVDSSDAVDAALWPCLARCTRNGQKIIPSTFDGEGREDYYDIVAECLTENFRPLIDGLLSKLPAGLLGAKKKSESAPESK